MKDWFCDLKNEFYREGQYNEFRNERISPRLGDSVRNRAKSFVVSRRRFVPLSIRFRVTPQIRSIPNSLSRQAADSFHSQFAVGSHPKFVPFPIRCRVKPQIRSIPNSLSCHAANSFHSQFAVVSRQKFVPFPIRCSALLQSTFQHAQLSKETSCLNPHRKHP
jgi:hypothetical protein